MERREALAAKLTLFRTGRPCRRGHVTDRFASTGQCMECLRLWTAERVSEDPFYRKDIVSRSHIACQESEREYRLDYRLKNPEGFRERVRRRRQRLSDAPGSHTDEDLARIRKKQKDCCRYCGAPLMGKGHRDHKVPLSRGGSNDPKNMQWLCSDCSLRKANKSEAEFIAATFRRKLWTKDAK
jgi:5-methylcytosine-specific restriction endonuclease McrA